MAINNKIFLQELYQEHLDEAAFCYESRLVWLQDAEIGWQDLDDKDITMEAHIDALMVGKITALNYCLESLAEAEAPVLHVIVRVFCRHRSVSSLSQLWIDFDFDDPEKVQAVSDALRWECPKEWLPALINVLNGDKIEMFPVVALSVAYHSPSTGKVLLNALKKCQSEQLTLLLVAISHCDKKIASLCINEIAPYFSNNKFLNNLALKQQAAKTLLIMGEARTLDQCRNNVGELPYLFALAGSQADSRLLIQLTQKGVADDNSLLAIGLSGNLEAVPNLLGYLKHPDHQGMAAMALQLITGANLYETVHVPDKVEADELFKSELEAFKNGELPKNADGNPYGSEVRQLSIEPKIWQQWLQSHKSQFVKGLRYRNGKPVTPTELLQNLIDNQTPYNIRQLIYEELLIRYGLDISFAADDLVYRQQLQLNKIYAWIEARQTHFKPGSWYFNANEISAQVMEMHS